MQAGFNLLKDVYQKVGVKEGYNCPTCNPQLQLLNLCFYCCQSNAKQATQILQLVSSQQTGHWFSSCLIGWTSSNMTQVFLSFPDRILCFPFPLLCFNGSVSPISYYNKSMWWPDRTVVADDRSYWTYDFNPEQAPKRRVGGTPGQNGGDADAATRGDGCSQDNRSKQNCTAQVENQEVAQPMQDFLKWEEWGGKWCLTAMFSWWKNNAQPPHLSTTSPPVRVSLHWIPPPPIKKIPPSAKYESSTWNISQNLGEMVAALTRTKWHCNTATKW